MDPIKILSPTLKYLGLRGVQLVTMAYLQTRYVFALSDNDFRHALLGSQTQATIAGYDIPYEVITFLTPAIVVWSELVARRFGHLVKPALQIRPAFGRAMSYSVLALSTVYFWMVYVASTRNWLSGDGVRPTIGLATLFTLGALSAFLMIRSAGRLEARLHNRTADD